MRRASDARHRRKKATTTLRRSTTTIKKTHSSQSPWTAPARPGRAGRARRPRRRACGAFCTERGGWDAEEEEGGRQEKGKAGVVVGKAALLLFFSLSLPLFLSLPLSLSPRPPPPDLLSLPHSLFLFLFGPRESARSRKHAVLPRTTNKSREREASFVLFFLNSAFFSFFFLQNQKKNFRKFLIKTRCISRPRARLLPSHPQPRRPSASPSPSPPR
jgi:hypothetical protein